MAKKAKGLPKRVGNKNKQARHARSYGGVAERKLRRMLRSCGPAFARQWATKAEDGASALSRLAKKQNRVGELAREALGKS
jgi:hypothetical protein